MEEQTTKLDAYGNAVSKGTGFKGIFPSGNCVLIEMGVTLPITELMAKYDSPEAHKHIEGKIHWRDFEVKAISGSEPTLKYKEGDGVIIPEQAVFTRIEYYLPHEQHPNNIYFQYKLPLTSNDSKKMEEARKIYNGMITDGIMFTVKCYALVEAYNIQAHIPSNNG